MPPIKGPSKPTAAPAAEQSPVEKGLKEKSKKELQAEKSRPLVYPDIDVQMFIGENALTVEDAKKFLGWQEETEDGPKFGGEYTLLDMNDKKVRCANNAKNRPLNEAWAKTLAQDILNKHWALNLETIIIGKHGSVLSGQHRLIGLVLAEQRRTSEKVMKDGTKESAHWKANWKGPVTIETLVALGGEETDTATRTLDNTRPRTLSDIVYTSDIFAKYKPKDREGLSRGIDYAIRLLWQRTGAYSDPYSPKRTHSEALDFIDRHPKIAEAVKHIYEENSGGNAVTKVFSPGVGTASGLLYLMACCGSDGDAYRLEDHPSEKKLDFEDWDKACEFWVELSQKVKSIQPLVKALLDVPSMGTWIDEASIRRAKIAVVINGWHLYREGNPFSADELAPNTATDAEDCLRVVSMPFLGTVDVGDGVEPYNPTDDDESNDPDSEEVAKRAEKERAEREAKKSGDKKKSTAASNNGKKAPAAPKPAAATETKPAEPSMITKEFTELKKKYPEAVILFRGDTEVFAYNQDAREIAKHLRISTRSSGDVTSAVFFRKNFDDSCEKLTRAGCPFVVVERRGDRWYDVADEKKPAVKPKKAVKT